MHIFLIEHTLRFFSAYERAVFIIENNITDLFKFAQRDNYFWKACIYLKRMDILEQIPKHHTRYGQITEEDDLYLHAIRANNLPAIKILRKKKVGNESNDNLMSIALQNDVSYEMLDFLKGGQSHLKVISRPCPVNASIWLIARWKPKSDYSIIFEIKHLIYNSIPEETFEKLHELLTIMYKIEAYDQMYKLLETEKIELENDLINESKKIIHINKATNRENKLMLLHEYLPSIKQIHNEIMVIEEKMKNAQYMLQQYTYNRKVLQREFLHENV